MVGLIIECLVLEAKESMVSISQVFVSCGSHCFFRLPWITLSSVLDAEEIVA